MYNVKFLNFQVACIKRLPQVTAKNIASTLQAIDKPESDQNTFSGPETHIMYFIRRC
jgi:hypothetical protein